MCKNLKTLLINCQRLAILIASFPRLGNWNAREDDVDLATKREKDGLHF